MENSTEHKPEMSKNDKLLLYAIRNQSKEMAGTVEFISGISKAISAFAEYGRNNYLAYEQQRQDYERKLYAGLAATNDYNEKIIFLEKENIELKKIILNKQINRWVGDAKFYTSVREKLVLPLLEIVKDEANLAMRIAMLKPVAPAPKIAQIIHLPIPTVKSVKTIIPKVNLTGNTKNSGNDKNVFGLSWNMDPKMITTIVDLIIGEKGFRSEDRSELLLIFHGKKRTHTEKIVCVGLQKRFPTVLFELEANDKLNSQKKEIAAWIMDNFKYQSKPEKPAQEFSLASLNDILNESKPKSRLHPGHKEYINVLSLFNS
ncbi:MAG TPA: hypothetical protein VFJ43_06680 [Bacteroidia bacterium]|nr:hypothetical protein [Bacteroidia bacterium]